MDLASNIMDASYSPEWQQIQSNGSAGAAGILNKLESFATEAFCRIQYDNNTEPFTTVKTTKNISKFFEQLYYSNPI